MSDLIFPCPHCANYLVIDEVGADSIIECPHCNKGNIVVPRPSLRASCPSCHNVLAAPKFIGVRAINCPYCNIEYVISKNICCISCAKNIPEGAVICVNCGVDQRSGNKLKTEVHPVSKLKLREQAAQLNDADEDESENPILARFPKPVYRDRSFVEKILPVLKTAAMFAALSIAAIYLFLNFKTVRQKLETMFSAKVVTNIVVVANKPVVTNLPPPVVVEKVVPQECKIVKSTLQTIEALISNPSDSFALRDLKNCIKTITDSGDGHVVIAGMKTVYALKQFDVGNEDVGLKGCDQIQQIYADTEFFKIVNKDNLYSKCPKCEGGQTKSPCSSCGGNKTCSSCRGTGTQLATKRVVNSLGKVQHGNKISMGAGLYTTTTVSEPCSNCRGGRSCTLCNGSGSLPSKCRTCKESGFILSKSNIASQLNIALNKTKTHLSEMLKGGRTLMLISQKENIVDVATMKALLVDKKRVGLFDGIIKSCAKYNIQISIDPDALDALSIVRADVSDFITVTNVARIESMIANYKLTVKKTPLTPEGTDTVFFITTDQTWVYSLACWYLVNGDINKALSILSANSPDNSPFGRHCQSLHSAIRNSIRNRALNDKLISSIKGAIKNRDDAFRNAQSARNAPSMESWHGIGKNRYNSTSEDAERSRIISSQKYLDDAERKLAEANASWESLCKNQESSNDGIWRRIVDAEDSNLRSEIYYWLDYLCSNYETLTKFTFDLQSKGALKSQTAQTLLGDIPEDLKTLKEDYRLSIQASRNEISATGKAKKDFTAKDTRIIEETLLADNASIFARINVGFLTAANHIKAANDVMGANLATSSEQLAILKELRDKRKAAYLLSAIDLINKDISIPKDASLVSAGAIGLAVVATHGELFPLSVKIVPITATTVRTTDASGIVSGAYWGGFYSQYSHLRVTQYESTQKSPAVTFVDYGNKDITMRVSAYEVYKWLCNAYPTNMGGKGIQVDFQSPFSNKAGPSAGVTMAVSAYSSLFGKPILKNVAMTGDCRSDGSVHAIGGVFEKVTAASSSDAIEIIIVPRENDHDLLFVPMDTLCRTCIVLSDDLSTYVSAATDPDFNKYPLEDLRKAQLLIRLGRFKDAEPYLFKVVGSNPDIYSAKRLLELLSCYEKLDDTAAVVLK